MAKHLNFLAHRRAAIGDRSDCASWMARRYTKMAAVTGGIDTPGVVVAAISPTFITGKVLSLQSLATGLHPLPCALYSAGTCARVPLPYQAARSPSTRRRHLAGASGGPTDWRGQSRRRPFPSDRVSGARPKPGPWEVTC